MADRVRGDTATIDRIFADHYVSTGNVDLVRTKVQVIEDLKSGALKVRYLRVFVKRNNKWRLVAAQGIRIEGGQ